MQALLDRRSRMAEQPSPNKDEKEESHEVKGHSFDSLKDPEKGKEFACAKCHGICREAVEMVSPLFFTLLNSIHTLGILNIDLPRS